MGPGQLTETYARVTRPRTVAAVGSLGPSRSREFPTREDGTSLLRALTALWTQLGAESGLYSREREQADPWDTTLCVSSSRTEGVRHREVRTGFPLLALVATFRPRAISDLGGYRPLNRPHTQKPGGEAGGASSGLLSGRGNLDWNDG